MTWLTRPLKSSTSLGLDLDCGIYYTNFSKNAVMQGKIREADIDKSLRRLYIVLMRLGFCDGIPSLKSLGKNDICSDDHIELVAEAAREGIVLLKNNNSTLPLSSEKYKTIAVIGPHANATDVMIGNYAGIANVIYELGCLDAACKNETRIFKAMQAAKKVDATIIFAGLDLTLEAEGVDRVDLLLPGYQPQLTNQIAMVSKVPVILVLLTAGCVDIGFAQGNPDIASIIWAGYPGEGGKAIADVVYGKYKTGGRLPITWYEANYVNVPMTSMQLRPVQEFGFPGRTFKFFNGSTVNYTLPSLKRAIDVKLSPYQHCRDLNYTDGAYRPPCPTVLVDDLTCNEEFTFEVQVLNNGSLHGNHVIMVYSKPPLDIFGTHTKKVIGFKRVTIPAGSIDTMKFKFNICKSLGIVDYTAYNVLPSGEHTIILDNGVDATLLKFQLKLWALKRTTWIYNLVVFVCEVPGTTAKKIAFQK